jgi:hypothetical protein
MHAVEEEQFLIRYSDDVSVTSLTHNQIETHLNCIHLYVNNRDGRLIIFLVGWRDGDLDPSQTQM